MKPCRLRTGAAALCSVLVFALLAFASGVADMAGPFKARCAELAREAEESGVMTVPGTEGWLFLASELRHIGAGRFWGADAASVSRARRPEHADPLPAILDFHEQLKSRGVALLMVPVPAKAVVYPEHLPGITLTPDDNDVYPRLDIHEQAFYAILRDNGIEVLDLYPAFMDARHAEAGPVYCRQDSHWSGAGCVIAAAAIAGLIRDMDWYENVPKAKPQTECMRIVISGDLWRAMDDEDIAREELMLRRTGMPSEQGLTPIEPDDASPVLLLGDSHTLVFHSGGDMHARWAGLADQLAFELGFAVDLAGVRGSGATPARINLFRRARNNPDYWTGKRVVVWCFSVREFTQSDGWRKIPIAP